MSETAPGQLPEDSIAPVYSIYTRRLLGQTAVTCATHEEPVPVPEVITPVTNIRTGMPLDEAAFDAWMQNGDIALRVFWSRADLPDNVVPLEDGRLSREVKVLCLSRFKPSGLPYPTTSNNHRHKSRLIRHPTDLL